jgi:hypothetical protein
MSMFKSLKKAKKSVSRIGCDTEKIVFSLEISSVNFPDNFNDMEDHSILSVCFERGGKIASSSDKQFDFPTDPEDSKTFFVNETLALLATLYKDKKTGKYQEKKGKIILRQLKKSRLGGDVYKGLGFVTLQLNDLAGELARGMQRVTLPLMGLQGTKINLMISARYLGAVEDDRESIMSGMSDSDLAANFDEEIEKLTPPVSQKIYRTIEEADEDDDSEASPTRGVDHATYGGAYMFGSDIPEKDYNTGSDRRHSGGGGMRISDTGFFSAGAMPGGGSTDSNDTPPPQELDSPEKPEQVRVMTKSGVKIIEKPPAVMVEQKLSKPREPSADSQRQTDHSKPTSTPAPVAAPSEGVASASASSSTLVKQVESMKQMHSPAMSASQESPSRSETKEPEDKGDHELIRAAVLEAHHQKSAEVIEMQAELDRLRRELNERDDEIAEIRHQRRLDTDELKAQIMTLRTDLNMANTELKREKLGRSQVAVANSKADTVLSNALARAREETSAIAEEYAKAAALLQAREEELKDARKLADSAVKSRDEERRAATEAATVAAAASLRRAELEAETEGMLEDLISTKIRCADLAQEVEEERRKVSFAI